MVIIYRYDGANVNFTLLFVPTNLDDRISNTRERTRANIIYDVHIIIDGIAVTSYDTSSTKTL